MQLPLFFFPIRFGATDEHAVIISIIISFGAVSLGLLMGWFTKKKILSIAVGIVSGLALFLILPEYFARPPMETAVALIEQNHGMIDENTGKLPTEDNGFTPTNPIELLDGMKELLHVDPVTKAAQENLDTLKQNTDHSGNAFWLFINGNPHVDNFSYMQGGGYVITDCPVQVLAWKPTTNHLWAFVEAKCPGMNPTNNDGKLIYKVDMNRFLYHFGLAYKRDLALAKAHRLKQSAHQETYLANQKEFEEAVRHENANGPRTGH